jgi:hypothetical protein
MDKKLETEKNPALPVQQPILLGCLSFWFPVICAANL